MLGYKDKVLSESEAIGKHKLSKAKIVLKCLDHRNCTIDLPTQFFPATFIKSLAGWHNDKNRIPAKGQSRNEHPEQLWKLLQ